MWLSRACRACESALNRREMWKFHPWTWKCSMFIRALPLSRCLHSPAVCLLICDKWGSQYCLWPHHHALQCAWGTVRMLYLEASCLAIVKPQSKGRSFSCRIRIQFLPTGVPKVSPSSNPVLTPRCTGSPQEQVSCRTPRYQKSRSLEGRTRSWNAFSV